MTSRSITAAGALALTALVAASASSAQAKTLVYCSEGSPENFNPMLNTTGTTFDANRPIYNRLVEFKIGSTEVARRRWPNAGTYPRGRQELHLPPAP